MIKTSDEGTSYCTQCEAYAQQVELYKELFLGLAKIEYPTELKIRVQQTAERIRFMESSPENYRLVMDQHRTFKAALAGSEKGDG